MHDWYQLPRSEYIIYAQRILRWLQRVTSLSLAKCQILPRTGSFGNIQRMEYEQCRLHRMLPKAPELPGIWLVTKKRWSPLPSTLPSIIIRRRKRPQKTRICLSFYDPLIISYTVDVHTVPVKWSASRWWRMRRAAYYNGIRYKAGEESPHGTTGYGIYVDWETKAVASTPSLIPFHVMTHFVYSTLRHTSLLVLSPVLFMPVTLFIPRLSLFSVIRLPSVFLSPFSTLLHPTSPLTGNRHMYFSL